MKQYLTVEITDFIPGRGRMAIFKKGLEPKIHEIISVNIDGVMCEKRVVALECGQTSKDVMVVLRDLDFPDPIYWSDKKLDGSDGDAIESLKRENENLKHRLDRAVRALRNLGSNLWRDL